MNPQVKSQQQHRTFSPALDVICFLLWLVLVVRILYSTLSRFAWSPLDVLNMAVISCDQIRAQQ